MFGLVILITNVVVIFEFAAGAKILLKSPQIESHIRSQLAFGEELKSRGHDVYVALASAYPKMDSIEKRGLKVLTYKFPDDVMYLASEEWQRLWGHNIFNESMSKMFQMSYLTTSITRDCSYMMADNTFLEKVEAIKFDLLLIEPFFIGSCNVILPHYLQLPFISMTGMYMPFDIRLPALPSFYPRHFYLFDDQEEISFTTRLFQTILAIVFEINYPVQLNTDTSLLKKYAPGVSSWKELGRKSELFFYESDHHMDAPYPSFSNLISVAGMSCRPAKALPTDLEKFVQSNEHGTILLSFGSIAQFFPRDVIVKFLNVFAKVEQNVVAKFIVPDGVSIPKNVRILDWLPQNDLLGHNKTRLFITHCGNNGQYEGLYHGVPMIGLPLFAEQDWNCHRGFMRGFGLRMDIHRFTEDELFGNIQEVLINTKYSATIKRASQIYHDQPMTAHDRAVYWTEHVIKYGGKHLRSSAMDLPLYQFLMFDVVGFLLVIIFIFSCCVNSVFRLVWKRVMRSSKEKLN